MLKLCGGAIGIHVASEEGVLGMDVRLAVLVTKIQALRHDLATTRL